MPPLDLEKLRAIRLAALEYWLTQRDSLSRRDVQDLQSLHTKIERAQNITELGVMTAMPTPNSGLGYPTKDQIMNFDPTSLTCMQFGKGPLEWYSFWAQTIDAEHNRQLSFVLVVNKLELAPPSVLERLGLTASDETCLWSISGGVGVVEGKAAAWWPIPYHLARATFHCRGETGFQFQTLAHDSRFVQRCVLRSDAEGQFKLDLVYLPYPSSPRAQSEPLTLHAQFHASQPAAYNGDGGCAPLCRDGVGIHSWSYPSLAVKVTATIPKVAGGTRHQYSGSSWFEHSMFSGNFITKGWVRWLGKLIASPDKTPRWIGLALQLDEPRGQWYYQRYLDAPPAKGAVLDKYDMLNQYNVNGSRKSFKQGEMNVTLQVLEVSEVKSFITETSVTVPTKYKLGLAVEDQEEPNYYILVADYGASERYSPNASLNVGSVGTVWNVQENRQLGACLLEFHQPQSDRERAEALRIVSGVPTEATSR